jgi:hypothetical protein
MDISAQYKISSVSGLKQNELKEMPYLGVASMFTHNVGWVIFYINAVICQYLSDYHFPDTIISKCVVTFIKGGMWNGAIVNKGLVVSKHKAFGVDRDSKISQGSAKINDLININSSSCKL